MTGQFIDLVSIEFWFVLIAAIFFVSPITDARYKSISFAAINCLFVYLLLPSIFLLVFVFIGLVFLFLRGFSGKFRSISILLIFTMSFILFLIQKDVVLIPSLIISPVETMLSVIGFSYIFLRLIDVSRAVFENRQRAPSLVSCINYLLPFHMLAAGPIQSYEEFIERPFEKPCYGFDSTLVAIERIVLGLFKKFVLAYMIQKTFLTGFESNGVYFFIEVQLFFLWLYLDFSAYSDIAVGIGKLIGVSTPENFNKPYMARNAIDFWERWHITLSQFVRRNVFVPAQMYLARKTEGRRPLLTSSIAFLLAFIICGLWHGVSINFLFWGLTHAAALIITNLYRNLLKKKIGVSGIRKYLDKRSILWLSRLITFEYVAFSLVFLFFP